MNKNYSGFNICISSGSLIKTHKQINLTTFYNYFPKPTIININPLSAYFFIQTLIKGFTSIFNSIKTGFKTIKDTLKLLFKNIKEALIKTVGNIIGFLTKKIRDFFDNVKNIINNFIKPIIKFIKFIFIAIPKIIFKTIKLTIVLIWHVIKNLWAVINKVYNVIKNVIQKVVYCLTHVKNVLLNIRATFEIVKHLYLYAKGIVPNMRIFRGFAVNGAHVYGKVNTQFAKKGEDIIRISKNSITYLKLKGNKLITLGKTFISSTGDVVSLIATKKGRAVSKAVLTLEAAILFEKYKFFIDTCHLNFDYIPPIKKVIKPKSFTGVKNIGKLIKNIFKGVKGMVKGGMKGLLHILPVVMGITFNVGAAPVAVISKILSMVLGFLFEGFNLGGFGSNYFELITILINQGRYFDAFWAGLKFIWDWMTWWNPVIMLADIAIHFKQYASDLKLLYNYLYYIYHGEVPDIVKNDDDVKNVDDAIIENGKLYPLNNTADLHNYAGKINFIRQIHSCNYQLELMLLYKQFRLRIAQENIGMTIMQVIKKILSKNNIDRLILDKILEQFKQYATERTSEHNKIDDITYQVKHTSFVKDPKNNPWTWVTLEYNHEYFNNIKTYKEEFINKVDLTKLEQQQMTRKLQEQEEQNKELQYNIQTWEKLGFKVNMNNEG